MSEKEEYENGENTFGTSKEGGIKVDSNPDYMAKEAVSTTKVKVEHLNFDGDRFKSEPQQAEQVTDVKTAEKFVSDTNRMMEEVQADEVNLEKSVMRQEIFAERITRIGTTANENVSKLARRQETNNRREEEKINQLNLELSTKLADLEEKRTQLESQVPSDMDAKIAFIQSRGGQELIGELLVDSLAENNDELISLAQSMVGERDVVNEDPKSDFGDLIERLATKHEFLVAEGGRDDMMAQFLHISKEASYSAGMSTEGNVIGKAHSTSLFDDPYASTGYGLLISENRREGGKTYKLSQRVGLDVDLGIIEFNFFEVDGFTQRSKATKLRFEGNTLNFSYQGENGEETWTINAYNPADMLIPGEATMLIPGEATMLIPGAADMLIPAEDLAEKSKEGMGE